MKALRDILSELVERRLWPVALLLVGALVATPLVLAKKPPASSDSGDAAAQLAATGAGARASGELIVSPASGPGADAPLRGQQKNPFTQQHVPRRPSSTGGGTPATGGHANGGAGKGGKQLPQIFTYASIDVRFGRAGHRLETIRDVPRLTPLPDAKQPIVIFMGMRADHETAVFLISTDVHAQGEGTCVPSKKVCEAIELRRGDVALLDWAAPDGSVSQYELDLDDVALHQTTSKAKAQASEAKLREGLQPAGGASAAAGTDPGAAAGTDPSAGTGADEAAQASVRAVIGTEGRAPSLTELP